MLCAFVDWNCLKQAEYSANERSQAEEKKEEEEEVARGKENG